MRGEDQRSEGLFQLRASPVPPFAPKNPDFAARVRDNFARQQAIALVGAEQVGRASGGAGLGHALRLDGRSRA